LPGHESFTGDEEGKGEGEGGGDAPFHTEFIIRIIFFGKVHQVKQHFSKWTINWCKNYSDLIVSKKYCYPRASEVSDARNMAIKGLGKILFDIRLMALIAPIILKLEKSYKITFVVKCLGSKCYFVNFSSLQNCKSF